MALISVAKIVRPQGIKGQLKAEPTTNIYAVFDDLKDCYIDGKKFAVKACSFRQDFLYIDLVGICDRTGAELLRGKEISVDKALLEKNLEQDVYLACDLVGMPVYDEQGALVGQVVDIENYGATDNLVIKCVDRTYQVPFLKDVFSVSEGAIVARRDKMDEVKV